MGKRYYTVEEVAKMLRVSRTTIYRMLKYGKLRALKLGTGRRQRSPWRIPEEEVKKLTK